MLQFKLIVPRGANFPPINLCYHDIGKLGGAYTTHTVIAATQSQANEILGLAGKWCVRPFYSSEMLQVARQRIAPGVDIIIWEGTNKTYVCIINKRCVYYLKKKQEQNDSNCRQT